MVSGVYSQLSWVLDAFDDMMGNELDESKMAGAIREVFEMWRG